MKDTQAKATADVVLEELTHVALGTQEYPSYDKTGEAMYQAPPLTARLRALELLGKHHQLFSPSGKKEETGDVGFIDDLEGDDG
ncbi:hypothetical protein RFF05_01755 [Bengtsoniella intestinalis]|uniref:hypothetical protein n=1 Tax=Bengtsoniella intestinalis TaxID=3073143 RepID=UPI00391F9F73